MTQVKQTVPHAYTVIEVDLTNVVRWREANNAAFKARDGASLSYVAVVVKAVTEGLGLRTVGLFAATTAIAVSVGMAVASLVRPGVGAPADGGGHVHQPAAVAVEIGEQPGQPAGIQLRLHQGEPGFQSPLVGALRRRRGEPRTQLHHSP